MPASTKRAAKPSQYKDRHRHAVRAVTIRWAQRRARHYQMLLDLRNEMRSAVDRIADVVNQIPEPQATTLYDAMAGVVGAYNKLHDFSGHNLPVDMRDYAAGVVDELRRLAVLREEKPR